VPLLLTQTAQGAHAASSGDHATTSGSSHSGSVPSWELAADRVAPGASGSDPAAGGTTPSADPASAVAPGTTTTVPVPTTTTTTEPAPTTTTTTRPVLAAAGAERTGIVTYYDDPGGPGTCASPTLPFGTVVTITNPANGASLSCRVNDREADTARQIDLDTASFAELAPLSQGVIDDARLSW
jgi:rare lipoprotein A